jgi:hypothetical protein
MLSKRFPFGNFYEVEDEVVYVYAILDLRRNPLWSRKQLRKRRISVRMAPFYSSHDKLKRVGYWPTCSPGDFSQKSQRTTKKGN